MEQQNLKHRASGQEQSLAQLERQVVRGSLFTHTIVSRNADQIHEAESVLYGIIDILVEKGMVTKEEVLQRADKVRQEMEESGLTTDPGIALRIEEVDTRNDEFVSVDCAERLHICKTVCCKLNFALTAEEVESRHIKWDLGEPYYIRQESTGYCHHVAPDTKDCSIYPDRPRVCRRYSCAHDERIWKNFEKMELNTEWIRENLCESRPRLLQAFMMCREDLLSGTCESSNGP